MRRRKLTRMLWIVDAATGQPQRIEAMRSIETPTWVEVRRKEEWPEAMFFGRVFEIGSIFLTKREALTARPRARAEGHQCP